MQRRGLRAHRRPPAFARHLEGMLQLPADSVGTEDISISELGVDSLVAVDTSISELGEDSLVAVDISISELDVDSLEAVDIRAMSDAGSPRSSTVPGPTARKRLGCNLCLL
jgi:hypothetical protein